MTTRILQAQTKTGRRASWEKHRKAVKTLADIYEQTSLYEADAKAVRLRGCAEIVAREKYADGTVKHRAAFCRVRLCPMCAWRRSRKVGAQMTAIMDAIKADKPCAYVFLTLTVKNCNPEDLNDTITHVFRAFSNLTKLVDFKRAVLGFYRSMEVTHNITFDTYHPHIHAILAVKPTYFSGRYYIKQAKWAEMWKSVLGVDYEPIVNVKRVKGDTAAAVAEVAKYTVKAEDYIIPEDWELSVKTVELLDKAFHKRRFAAYGGIFREKHKDLHLTDPDTPEDDLPKEEPVETTYFEWDSVYRQYREIDINGAWVPGGRDIDGNI